MGFILTIIASLGLANAVSYEKIGIPLRKLPFIGTFFSCVTCVSFWCGALVAFATPQISPFGLEIWQSAMLIGLVTSFAAKVIWSKLLVF